MSGRREDDMSALAWPGFVDILSAVVIMFVFFLLITATALFFHTLIFKNKIMHQSDVQVKSSVQQEDQDDLNKEIYRLKAQTQELQEIIAGTETKIGKSENEINDVDTFRGAQLEESNEQAFDVSKNKMMITIYFGKSSVTLSSKIQADLQDFLDNHKSGILTGEYNIRIHVGKSLDAPTENVSREIALARMFNLRNELLKIKELPKNSITANVKDPEKIKGTYHWGKIIIEKSI